MEIFSLLNNIITSNNNNISKDGNTEMCYRLILWAAEQIDSAPVVTLSMHGVSESDLH